MKMTSLRIRRTVARWVAFSVATAVSAVGLVLVGAVPSNAQDGTCDFDAGSGTTSNPYQVATVADLEMVRSCHASQSGLYFLMTRDIDLESVANWVPIGATGYQFTGSFDGGGHRISNLSSTATSLDEFSGLFGVVGGGYPVAQFHNLNISNANITQFYEAQADEWERGHSYSGILIGEAKRGIWVTGVEISNSRLSGSQEIGAVLGYTTADHHVFEDIRISNVTIQTPNFPIPFGASVQRVGLVAGHTNFKATFSDVEVIDSAIEINSTADVQKVAGFHVGCEQDMFFSDSSVSDVSINITSGGDVSKVGGFASGDPYIDDSCYYNNLTVDAEIAIDANGDIYDVGGLFNLTEQPSVVNTRSNVVLDLTSGAKVYRVGGVVGNSDEGSYDSYARSEFVADISIASSGADAGDLVHDIGLFFGKTSHFTVRDVRLSGGIRITVPEGETVNGVSNFIGFQRDEEQPYIRSVRNVIVDAEPAEVLIGGSSSYAPYSQLIGDADFQDTTLVQYMSGGVFWNNNRSPGYSSDEIGEPASQANLNSQRFLAAAGYNFDRDWCMINGEARVASVNPGCIEGSDAGVELPAVSVVTSGTSSFDSAGGLLQLEGDGLRGLGQVKLGNQSLFVQTLSDTTASVLIPAGLSAGSYDLEVTGLHGTLRMQSAVTITAPSVDIEPGYWTQLQPDGTVKMYAKNIIGEGKVQFYQNGEEIAWINATDALDPKLSSANGFYYLVRTRELVDGKNAFEIYLDGTRIWRAAYSKR